MSFVPKRIKTDKDILSFARRVKTAFFSGLSFFVVFLIFAGFGLAVAYLMHLIVSIGDKHQEPFSAPAWLKKFEPYSIGFFILALLVLAGIEPWKDVYRYFRYGTVEPEQESVPTSELGESREQEVSPQEELAPVIVDQSILPARSRSQPNSRKNNRRKRH